MRVIVYGLGAIGGCVGALLQRGGTEVLGIARGAQLEAVQAHGLHLRAPGLDEVVPLPCVAAPGEVDWRAGDVILLCMKTQHTIPALEALRDAGVTTQPIFCMQNGVTNEDMALRMFPNVHGATVMMPATYLHPGRVVCFGQPKFGVFDLGRYPRGSDDADAALAARMDRAGMAGFVQEAVMASKYGKLLVNLGNILQAALGRGADFGDLPARLRSEALAVFDAAGIVWEDKGDADPRRKALMTPVDVEGETRQGGSSAQSLLRGAGSIETDFLNGEITRLGRLYGIATPVNAAMQGLGARLVRDGLRPGQLTLAEIEHLIAP